MCGITGFTHTDKQTSRAILQATQSLRHRGPDELNVFQSRNVSLGVVRLKIIDLQDGQQPMATEAGDCVLAFNGEIYNHVGLRRALEQLGHKFQSACDTEVVLRAFIQWDIRCLERFRGMFAGAFWQEHSQRLILFRDRLGIKPLYYTVNNGQIFFGSELKALFQHDQIPRQLSKEALAYFLSLNYVPGPLTLVKGIEKVQPGTWLEWKSGTITAGSYWRNVMDPESISLEDALQQLDVLLRGISS